MNEERLDHGNPEAAMARVYRKAAGREYRLLAESGPQGLGAGKPGVPRLT